MFQNGCEKIIYTCTTIYVYKLTDWDRFVHASIQLWEDLYSKWLVKSANVLLIHYEDLKDAQLRRDTLQEIGNFLGLEVSNERLECVSRHPYTKFQRKEMKCLGDKGLERNTANLSPLTDKDSHRTTKDIFETKHKIWINSAIESVYSLFVKKFGLHSKDSRLLKYKNSIVKVNICQRFHDMGRDT